jgi:4-hydroxybenzoate polyprenyltransferase
MKASSGSGERLRHRKISNGGKGKVQKEKAVGSATACVKIGEGKLLLLFLLVFLLLRIALFAGFFLGLGVNAALVAAFLASLLGVVAAAGLHIGSHGHESGANNEGQQFFHFGSYLFQLVGIAVTATDRQS